MSYHYGLTEGFETKTNMKEKNATFVSTTDSLKPF